MSFIDEIRILYSPGDDRFFLSCRSSIFYPFISSKKNRHATDTCVDTHRTENSLCRHVSTHVRSSCHCVDTCVGNVSYRHGPFLKDGKMSLNLRKKCWSKFRQNYSIVNIAIIIQELTVSSYFPGRSSALGSYKLSSETGVKVIIGS